MHHLIEVVLIPSKSGWFLKQSVVLSHDNLHFGQAASQKLLKVIFVTGIRFKLFSPPINGIIHHHALLEFSA